MDTRKEWNQHMTRNNSDRLVKISEGNIDSKGRGFDPGTSTNFKGGLGLERDPPSLVRTIG